MAKQYHPDFLQGDDVTDAQRHEASEMFKKIQKAYEVLSNPIARQAYDIENDFNDGRDGEENVGQDIYEDSTSRRSYFQPKQQQDFYYTKWTGYKQPDWFSPYNGIDARSEFLYFRKNALVWPRIDQVVQLFLINRFFCYLMAFFAFNVYDFYKHLRCKQRMDLDIELLEQSFRMEELQENQNQPMMNETSMLDMVKGIEDDDQTEGIDIQNAKIQMYLDRYINERVQSIEQERGENEEIQK